MAGTSAIEERRPLPIRMQVFGWAAFVGALAWDLRIVYEQTILTWRNGSQMLGFAMVHLHPELLIGGVISLICVHIWLVWFLVLWARRLTSGSRMRPVVWVQLGLITVATALPYIPYSLWQIATLELVGPGSNAGAQLAIAATGDQRLLVKELLRLGVSIEGSTEWGGTALNMACQAEELEMARYLISKGAKIDAAPNCRHIVEFGRQMKQFLRPVESNSGLPQVPATTIEVHADAPHGPPMPQR